MLQIAYTEAFTAGHDSNSLQLCNDLQLINLFNQQSALSASAFAILSQRYHGWIQRRCLFRLGNLADAEDACQDIILRLFHKLHLFEQRAAFKTWLDKVIYNYCMTVIKQREKLNNQQSLDADAGTHLDDLMNDQNLFIDDIETLTIKAELLDTSLDRLSSNARQIIHLRFFTDKSLAEIAIILSLSLSATKARLYRALEQLKRVYLKINADQLLFAELSAC